MGIVEQLRNPVGMHIPHAIDLMEDAAKRIEALEDALRRVVRDVNDYEETNKLSPSPGRTECWDSVAHAKAVLANRT